MVKQLARLVARFHSLRPPISNKSSATKQTKKFDKTREIKAFQPVFEKEYLKVLEQSSSELKENYCKSIQQSVNKTIHTLHSTDSIVKEFDVEKLMSECGRIVSECESPLVFAHSDLNRSNRLINESLDENGNPVKRIYLIDFDYSCYGRRETDITAFFVSYKHKDHLFGDGPYPSDEEMKLFLDAYRLESEKLHPGYLEDPINSMEAMIKETKLFSLKGYMFLAIFALSMVVNSKDNVEKMKYYLVMVSTH